MTQEITIKKSTYNQILVGIVVLAVAFSFATGYMLGGSGSITGNVVAQQHNSPPPSSNHSSNSLQEYKFL